MIITKTRPLLWHVALDDHTPAGEVDLDPAGYVAMRYGYEIVAIEKTLAAAAEALVTLGNLGGEMFVKSMELLLASICGDEQLNFEKLNKAIFKGTECGASVQRVDSDAIQIHSIVEGSDAEVSSEKLVWPFAEQDFWDAVQFVDDEACRLWNEERGGVL